jgi:ATP-binding cassette subfamily F protein 3
MLLLKELHLRLGGRVIYDSVSASIGPRDRIALVGANGAGKSTLLKLLLGELEPDGGKIERAGFVTLGYLPQDGVHARGRSVRDEVESAAADVVSLRSKLEQAGARLHALDATSDEYRELLILIAGWEHQLEDLGAHRLRADVEKLLLGLGFTLADLDRDTGEFSGGWQMRIALAKLLLKRPSLLLLDEPTNHLDLDSLRWLENFLSNYEGALLIVSHDRAFLDRVVDRTFHLNRGRLDAYSGNYSFFETEAVARAEQLERMAKNQERQITKTQEFIDRFRYKASKAAQVQSRLKALAKIDRIELEEDEAGIGFSFPEPPRSGEKVLELRAAAKSYGDKVVFGGLDLVLTRGERVAVVGVNGAGKSTLVRMLAGSIDLTGGERITGHNVRIAYFAQHQADELDPKLTALETLEVVADPGSRTRLRTILGSFLFRGDDVHKPVSVLSGGEKSRLALAKMLLLPFNCLILDEPTNHLDMRSIEVLKGALEEYSGTLILVSHERAFLEPLVTKVWEVRRGGTVRVFPGRFGEFLAKLDEERTLEDAKPSVLAANTFASGSAKDQRRLRAQKRAEQTPLRKRHGELESLITRLETRQKELEAAMMDPSFFKQGDQTTRDMQEYERVKAELDVAMTEWMEISEVLEAS